MNLSLERTATQILILSLRTPRASIVIAWKGWLLVLVTRLPISMTSETAGSIRFESNTSLKTMSDIRGSRFVSKASEAALPKTAAEYGVIKYFSKQFGIRNTNGTKSLSVGLEAVLIRSFSMLRQ